MPSFSYMDAFREGQWRAFRAFILRERRSVGEREATIRAELSRIGKIRILYGTDPTTEAVSEERIGIVVEGNEASSVAKLMQAYVALGGNPFDVSMFLYSNDEECPGMGFAYPLGMQYNLTSTEVDLDSNVQKYKPSEVGGARALDSEKIAKNMDMARRWTIQEMYQKRILLEERIIKLSDLYEQLEQEITGMVNATMGEGMTEAWSSDLFQESHSVPALVYLFDATFRVAEDDGTVPATAEINIDELGGLPMLLADVSPADDNNAL
jgi:hypothetical protein